MGAQRLQVEVLWVLRSLPGLCCCEVSSFHSPASLTRTDTSPLTQFWIIILSKCCHHCGWILNTCHPQPVLSSPAGTASSGWHFPLSYSCHLAPCLELQIITLPVSWGSQDPSFWTLWWQLPLPFLLVFARTPEPPPMYQPPSCLHLKKKERNKQMKESLGLSCGLNWKNKRPVKSKGASKRKLS